MMLFPWRRPLKKRRDSSPSAAARRARPARVSVESLEGRTLLSATLVKTINTTTLGSMGASDAVTLNGAAYFTTSDGHKDSLWKTDGTPGGTTLVKTFLNIPKGLAVVNGTLFFPASDGSGWGLWESNGTAAGTALVKAMNSADPTVAPSDLTDVNGTLFFGLGSELWKSDGTAAGTVLVQDLPTPVSNLTPVNGTLFFTAAQQANFFGGPGALWKSDGTAAGTFVVKDGLNSNLTNVNGTLFFDTGSSSSTDFRPGPLWKTDGTP
jgi:ELWxxDGT repeat protein